MKRTGMGELQANGHAAFELRARRGGRPLNGRSDVARKIEKSIAYMSQHLNESLNVANLAAVANVSPSHYSALFKRLTGSSPIDFFIRLRMQQACRLFESTSLNVKEVAAVLGYEDPFYFSRLFKSVNRLAPNDYRLKKAGKSAAGVNGPDLSCLPSGNRAKIRFNVSSSNKNQPNHNQ